MPNVLLTFEEIADLFHCDSAGARSLVIQNQWERRRWADGLPRVQVPPEVAHQFMLHYAAKFEHPPANIVATVPAGAVGHMDEGAELGGSLRVGREIARLL